MFLGGKPFRDVSIALIFVLQAGPQAADAWQVKQIHSLSALEPRQESAQPVPQPSVASPVVSPKYKIYTFWHYPNGPSPHVALNVETWRAHSPPGTEIVLVNDTNFPTLVPDAPEEWFRLPYSAAKSDVVRAAVLYHHGGLYLDTDFIALGPLGKVLEYLDQGWDVVAYTDGREQGEKSAQCSTTSRFSSNFMAARQGNLYSKTWWTNTKAKLTRLCGEGEFSVEKICCNEAFAPKPEKRLCHIPWGQIEHLKNPDNDHDTRGPPRKDPTQSRNKTKHSVQSRKAKGEAGKVLALVAQGNARALQVPDDVQIYCLRGNEGMAPHVIGQLYWQPWNSVASTTDTSLVSRHGKDHFDLSFACRVQGKVDLVCDRGNWGNHSKVFENFFGHIAYHLFFSTTRKEAKTKKDILEADWLLSEMYRRSLKSQPGKMDAQVVTAAE